MDFRKFTYSTFNKISSLSENAIKDSIPITQVTVI